MRLRPGDTFDRYLIESLLGEGGMGEVYQARDVRLERRVALKVLRKEAADDPDAWNRALVRMLREARAAAALNHPNTVAIYDISEKDGQPFLAMELIDGVSLRQLLGGGASTAVKLGWLLDVARALSAAHRAGLVHRDVKPENVMLRSDGTIKVLDFGIARRVNLDVDEVASTQRGAGRAPLTPQNAGDRISALPGSADTVTGEGVMVGTPAYMAPEQLRGEPVDARTDQFGWGVLAYELLTGRVPFGAGLEGVKLLSAILSDEPPSLEGIVPSPVERVLRRTVAKRQADRLPSMDHVVDALAPFVTAENAGGLHDVLVGDSRTSTSSAPQAAGAPAHASTPVEASRPGGGTLDGSVRPPPVAEIGKPETRMTPATGPTHTMRSPDIEKAMGRGTPVPPTPVVRVENAYAGISKANNASTTLESPAVVPRAPTRPSRPWWLWPAIGLGGIWAVAAGVWGYWIFQKNPPVEPAAPSPAVVPTPITELPLATPSNPEAVAAYKEGLQSVRDASWELARTAFERATKLDSSLGVAFLRLAVIDRFRKDTASARTSFQRAMQLRGTLSPRDQELLDAFEPIVQEDPPDFAESRKRMSAAALHWPGDAEFVYLQLALDPSAEPTRQLELAERCLELDSKYADCWQVRFSSNFRLGREHEALDALDRCVSSAPSALDCLLDRISMNKYMGRCDRIEADVRRWITKDQRSAQAYRELAVALDARGEGAKAVSLAVEQAARRFGEEGRIERADDLRIRWALLSGDFEGAEEIAQALERAVAEEPLEEKHVVPARALVQIYLETGQERKAAEVSERFLTERAAWTKPLYHSPWSDFTTTFISAKRMGGMLDDPARDAARDAWEDAWSSRKSETDRTAIWLSGRGLLARTEAEARSALAVMPTVHPANYYSVNFAWTVDEMMGRVYFFANDSAKALPYLERASRACMALDAPIRHVTATYRLGVVRQALGDERGACAAFQLVAKRWGHAKRSATARDALARAKALRCQE